MIPSIVFEARDFQNEFPSSALTPKVTVSRGRDVVIKNTGLTKGLHLFKYDDQHGHYYGVLTHTSPLAFVKLKAFAGGNVVVSNTHKAKVHNLKLDPNLVKAIQPLLQEGIGLPQDIENYTFEIKATEKVKPTVTRNEINSVTIENQFRSGRAHTSDGELLESNDGNVVDMFLAYVYFEKKDERDFTILVDVGELWDEGMLDIRDLEDIFNDPKGKQVDIQAWNSTIEMTATQKQEMIESEKTRARTRAFDDIMKSENGNFNSNL